MSNLLQPFTAGSKFLLQCRNQLRSIQGLVLLLGNNIIPSLLCMYVGTHAFLRNDVRKSTEFEQPDTSQLA